MSLHKKLIILFWAFGTVAFEIGFCVLMGLPGIFFGIGIGLAWLCVIEMVEGRNAK